MRSINTYKRSYRFATQFVSSVKRANRVASSNAEGFSRFGAHRCLSLPSSSKDAVDETSKELTPSSSSSQLPTTALIDFDTASSIQGEESQTATIQLRPGETLRAESGAMLFMTQGIVMDTKLEGATAAFSRVLTGQNVFLTDYRYDPESDPMNKGYGSVGLGTDFPSKIMKFSLSDFENNSLICQRGAFLACNSPNAVSIETAFTKSFTSGFFGGQGFVLQKLTGEGDVLVKGGGTIVKKELNENETLRVTSGSIVAFEPTVQYDVEMMKGISNTMFGGEGLFVTTLQGPGTIWLQGMPPDRMIAEIARRVPAGGGGLVVPMPMGGGAETAGAPVDEPTNVEGASDDAGLTSDAGIDADRQATVASSAAGDVDSESPEALFGDTISPDDVQYADKPETDDFANTSQQDNVEFFGGDEEKKEDDWGWDDSASGGNDFEDATEDSVDFGDFSESAGESAAEGGQDVAGQVLRGLWDLFTGGDD